MGVNTIAISVKPWYKKWKVILGISLIAIAAILPNIEEWWIFILSIAAAISGAIFLTLGITYIRWATKQDCDFEADNDELVIVQNFTKGEGRGHRLTSSENE